MSFQVEIGSLGGTVFFQVGLCTPLRTMGGNTWVLLWFQGSFTCYHQKIRGRGLWSKPYYVYFSTWQTKLPRDTNDRRRRGVSLRNNDSFRLLKYLHLLFPGVTQCCVILRTWSLGYTRFSYAWAILRSLANLCHAHFYKIPRLPLIFPWFSVICEPCFIASFRYVERHSLRQDFIWEKIWYGRSKSWRLGQARSSQ